MKRAGSDGPRCTARSACATRLIDSVLAHALDGHDRSFDEARHEVALGLDERHDVGADTDRGGGEGRLVLDGAIDPEQGGVVAGDAEDVRVPGERRP